MIQFRGTMRIMIIIIAACLLSISTYGQDNSNGGNPHVSPLNDKQGVENSENKVSPLKSETKESQAGVEGNDVLSADNKKIESQDGLKTSPAAGSAAVKSQGVNRNDEGKNEKISGKKESDIKSEVIKSNDAGTKAVPVQTVQEQSGTFQNGLLEINDERFKYKRIPGLVSTNDTVSQLKNVEEIIAQDENADTGDGKAKTKNGLFGFSKKTTEVLTKGSLILLVLIIFILTRLRSKRYNKKVLRSFPQK